MDENIVRENLDFFFSRVNQWFWLYPYCPSPNGRWIISRSTRLSFHMSSRDRSTAPSFSLAKRLRPPSAIPRRDWNTASGEGIGAVGKAVKRVGSERSTRGTFCSKFDDRRDALTISAIAQQTARCFSVSLVSFPSLLGVNRQACFCAI